MKGISQKMLLVAASVLALMPERGAAPWRKSSAFCRGRATPTTTG